MKHIKILVATVLFCFPLLATAQPGSPLKVDLGIKVGANFSSLSGNGWDNGLKAGLLGGVYGGVHTSKFGGQIELLFSQVKYDMNTKVLYDAGKNALGINPTFNSQADSNKNGSVAVSYLQIPILFNLKVKGPIWLQIGPQYTSIIGLNDKENIFKDVKTVINTGDVSGVIGLQVKLTKLNVGARYIIGFSDLNSSSVSESWKQRTIQLHIGYSFL